MAAVPYVPNDPLEDLLGYQLRRLSQLTMADLAGALEPLGLRPAESSVLFTIAANPDITQSDVGRMLGVKRANMAPLIAGLESRELISRVPMDGRSQALRLTAKGETLHAAAQAATRAHEARCFGTMAESERARLVDQIHQLWTRLDAEDPNRSS